MTKSEINIVCEMPFFASTTKEIEGILSSARTIAIVGLSPNEEKDSNRVARYLLNAGYEVIPINPNCNNILGMKSYPDLRNVPQKVEIVDIFRKPDAVPEIVEQAIEKRAKLVWMQEGIVHNKSAEEAKKAGLKVVMNKCIMKELRKWVHDKK